jgi:hypothetical protein
MFISASKQSLHIAKRNLSNFDESSVIFIRIEILRHLNAFSIPVYTPYVLHVHFSVETIPANRKTQSFKFRRKLCYFDPDWDTTPFKRFFYSSLHAEPIPCRYQCLNNPCKSQNAIFQISTKTLLFRSGLRYSAFKSSLHSILHAERTACSFQRRNNPCKSQNAIFQISTKTLVYRSGLRYYAI